MRKVRKKLNIREKLKKLSEERKKEGPLLRAKRIYESRPPTKPRLLSIEELRMPQGVPLNRMDIITSKDRLEETLALKENPDVQVRWTVAEDAYAEEFGSIVKEGFVQVKTRPPTYAYEYGDGGIAASHLGSYTFIIGSYNIKVEKLAEILEFALDSLKSKIS